MQTRDNKLTQVLNRQLGEHCKARKKRDGGRGRGGGGVLSRQFTGQTRETRRNKLFHLSALAPVGARWEWKASDRATSTDACGNDMFVEFGRLLHGHPQIVWWFGKSNWALRGKQQQKRNWRGRAWCPEEVLHIIMGDREREMKRGWVKN
jgi:hypothetical protein